MRLGERYWLELVLTHLLNKEVILIERKVRFDKLSLDLLFEVLMLSNTEQNLTFKFRVLCCDYFTNLDAQKARHALPSLPQITDSITGDSEDRELDIIVNSTRGC